MGTKNPYSILVHDLLLLKSKFNSETDNGIEFEFQYHFLCDCPAYEAHGELLYKLSGIFSTSNEARFKDSMESNEPSFIEALSNFLKEASDIRRNHQGR